MPKNANSMGTVRKRSDGRWEARYTTPDGKQKSIYAKTQKAVTEALRAVLRDIDTGEWLEPSKLSMAEWLTIWLRDHQSHTTGDTVRTYEAVVRKHMIPLFGEVKLADFSAIHARRMVTIMTDSGLSPTTVRYALTVLNVALCAAVTDGLIRTNPASSVKPPKKAERKFTVVDRDRFRDFAEAVQATSMPDVLLFLLLTGTRINEMRGLRWSDVDLDAGTISINHQLYTYHKSREFRPPKEGRTRDLHVGAEVIALLRRHRKAQAADRLRAEDWTDDNITADLVFRRPNGQPLSEDTVRRVVAKVGEALGLPSLHPHDLRHSYAVAALRSGVDVKTVQHNLGHKSATITLDVYAAYTDDAGKAAADRLSAYFTEAMGAK